MNDGPSAPFPHEAYTGEVKPWDELNRLCPCGCGQTIEGLKKKLQEESDKYLEELVRAEMEMEGLPPAPEYDLNDDPYYDPFHEED